MGDSRRPILILVVALFAAGVLLTLLAVGVGVWFGGGALFPDKATLNAREAAARATRLDVARLQLRGIAGWRVVAARAAASYYTQGSSPVDQRWGLASAGDVVGPDAGKLLFGTMRFVVVGQCSGTREFNVALAFGAAAPGPGGSPPPQIAYAKFGADRIPCDSHAHAVVSEPFSLPSVSPAEQQWVHVFFSSGDENAPTASRLAILVASPDAIYDLAVFAALAEDAFGGPLP